MPTAMTRRVSPSLAACNLTFLAREPIDVSTAIRQHGEYEQCLRDLGADVISLPPEPDCPDAVFVEDPAIVLDEIAVMCRMGVESRRAETGSLAAALAPYRELRHIREPGTIEGGDVVRIGRTLYVGLSSRTNRDGIAQLTEVSGYDVVPVQVTGCLHLKSACCSLGDGAVLINPAWIDPRPFAQYRQIRVVEPWAADVLRLGGVVLMPDGFPKTREVLEQSGFRTRAVDVTELQKAEAGVTCMSLIF